MCMDELFGTRYGLTCVDCGGQMRLEDGVSYHEEGADGEDGLDIDLDHVARAAESETLGPNSLE